MLYPKYKPMGEIPCSCIEISVKFLTTKMFTCCARPEAELLGHLPPVVGVLGLDLHLVVRLHLQLDNINQ